MTGHKKVSTSLFEKLKSYQVSFLTTMYHIKKYIKEKLEELYTYMETKQLTFGREIKQEVNLKIAK
jgi:hypothetical protein